MTTDSVLRTVFIVLAVLVSIPLFMMGIAMPLMGLTGLGGISGGHGSSWMFLVPVVPTFVLGTLGYVLYSSTGDGNRRQADSAVEQLRSAYARGELSDEEFETRRERLQTPNRTSDTDEGSTHD